MTMDLSAFRDDRALSLQEDSWCSFLLETDSILGRVRQEGLGKFNMFEHVL
jgi:hypothetical protein